MALNPVIQLTPNGTFDPGDPADLLATWQWNIFPAPTIPFTWNAATLLPANGSGGAIPFPTFNGNTPAAYTAPATNAPAGNAAYVYGWNTTLLGQLIANMPLAIAGARYNVAIHIAGDPARPNLKWYYGLFFSSAEGVVGTNGVLGAMTQFDPTTGWQTVSFTWVPQAAGTPTFFVYGGGTDGVLPYQQATGITGASVAAPVLIAGVSVSYASQGGRAYPPQALPVGNYTGAVMSGGDARVPRLDSNYMLRPREEVVEFELLGANYGTTSAPAAIVPTKPLWVGFAGCFLVRSMILAEQLSTDCSATFDFTVNGASIFPANAVLPNIQGDAGSHNVGGFGGVPWFAVHNFYIGSAAGGAVIANLGAQLVTIAAGTFGNLLIKYWIYHP